MRKLNPIFQGIKKLSLLIIFLEMSIMVFATHNRAGEITYRRLNNFTYEVTITTYTKTSSVQADRPALEFVWGDGTPNTILPRIFEDPNTYSDRNIKVNRYKGTHTYPGPGKFKLFFNDPNRNSNIINLSPPGGSSDQVPFYLESELLISPFTSTQAANTSPILLYPPIDLACKGAIFEHNPGAYDPDGDSLSYKLVPSKGENGAVLDFFVFPDQISPGVNNSLTIDPISGDMVWDAPQQTGEYNIAILIEEWRDGIVIGSVLRDMQILVQTCNNQAPKIAFVNDTCVIAGTSLNFNVTASDITSTEKIALSAVGFPLDHPTSPATFNPGPAVNPSTGIFTWNTSCDNIQKAPYHVLFRAEDNNAEGKLVDLQTMNIQVIAPAPNITNIISNVGSNTVSWDVYGCSNADGFKIYRKQGSALFTPSVCETGLPPSLGYTLVGTSTGSGTIQFIDNTAQYGTEYCYRMIATFADGSESIASNEFCISLQKDIPIIYKASVGSTSTTIGIDTVQWAAPIALNATVFPGPYQYKIFRGTVINTDALIFTSTINATLTNLDTSFIDNNLNTQDTAYFYRVEAYSLDGGVEALIGSSAQAKTVYSTPIPGDKKITVTWDELVPWSIDSTQVFKFNAISSLYEYVTSVIGNGKAYTDLNLVNGEEYCYKVRSFGKYFTAGLPVPISNFSQEICVIAEDTEAPCPVTVSLDADCPNGLALFTWSTPDPSCDTDQFLYTLYRQRTPADTFRLAAQITASELGISYLEANIAGCYYVKAQDTVGNISEQSNIVCIESCVEYRLPNVFTPNGDGVNDFFTPFPFFGVQKVEAQILNRWGQVIYETTDPNLNWNGQDQRTNNDVPEATYFYIIKLLETEATLEGKTFSGSFELYRK